MQCRNAGARGGTRGREAGGAAAWGGGQSYCAASGDATQRGRGAPALQAFLLLGVTGGGMNADNHLIPRLWLKEHHLGCGGLQSLRHTTTITEKCDYEPADASKRIITVD